MPKISIRTISLLASLVILMFWAYSKSLTPKEPPVVQGTWLSESPEVPSFQLSDSKSQPFTKQNLLGQWTILSFGFTHCPDVCPTTLAYFRDEIKALTDSDKAGVQFVFVGVDPERDPPAALGSFTGNFHPDIKAVTGDEAALNAFAGIFHAYFKKEGKTKDGLYGLAHSPQYFVINPEGKWQVLYTPPMAKGALAIDLQKLQGASRG